LTLALNSRLGAYEILALIGQGGMGEVYRAKDTKLGRDVALKILPASFTNNPERVARFRREAQVLASLNHPHIAQIYGLERQEGQDGRKGQEGQEFLVLEFVDGESLDRRIARGPIPIDEALGIATQIAEALEAAHERGVIHRDLKPANVALTKDGQVKVLDFGLAKAVDASAPLSGASMSPTITSPAMMTGVGVILGTAAYMSPEQAKGRPADKRSDVWAFGCLLYEMLTGRRAFDGEDVSDTLANVLKSEPDWTRLPRSLRSAVLQLLKGCLQKDRSARVADFSTPLFVIRDMSADLAPVERPVSHRAALMVAAAVAVGALTGAIATRIWTGSERPMALPVTRLTIPLGSQNRFSTTGRHVLALSPDGTRLVYAANGQLYLRPLKELEAVPIRGTAGGTVAEPNALTGAAGRSPFFSPDGKWVGFWQDQQLKKVLVDGGTPVPICAAGNMFGATWATDNTIVYGEGPLGIYRVSADGGTPALVVSNPGGVAHGPQLLPGNRALLFTLRGATDEWDESQIVVQSLDTGRRQVLLRGTDARYLETGHLVYVANGTLFAVPFDAASLKILGGPVSLVEHVAQSAAQTGAAHFATSQSGSLAYIAGSFRPPVPPQTLVWLDRQGRETPLNAPVRAYAYPRVSPDGNRIAVQVAGENIWLWDVKRETLSPLTSGRDLDLYPLWTRLGDRLAYRSTAGIFWRAVDGSGSPEQLAAPSGGSQLPNSFTPDGRLIYTGGEGNRLEVLTLGPSHRVEALPVAPAGVATRNGEVSPDGKMLAYETNESGQMQVVVRPFPNVEGGRRQISNGGGVAPAWSRDGRELFYVGPAGGIMRVQTTDEATLMFSAPTKLVDGPYTWGLVVLGSAGRTYDVHSDRFLVMKPAPSAQRPTVPDSIVVVQNWFEELKARVPTK
jgi:serine/threonine-protein kinase